MLKCFIILILVIAILFFAECRRELTYFVVRKYQLSLTKFNKIHGSKKIVILADLHSKVYGKHNDILIDAVKKENPDIILIAGDMLVGKIDEDTTEAVHIVLELVKIARVYYVLGNHEQRLKENVEEYGTTLYTEYYSQLNDAGVVFLENSKADLEFDELKVSIYGLELPMYTYNKFERHHMHRQDVEGYLGRPDKERFNILLAHNPLFVPAYKEWGADLMVSGHLHGGLIRIPGIGAVITPQARLFPKYSGEMRVEDEQAVIVSRGLGTHTVNVRFFNQAELVSLELLPS